jgi:hypothetical protein
MPEQNTPLTEALPSAGGSYTRQLDGTLVKDEAAPVITTATAASADLIDTAAIDNAQE